MSEALAEQVKPQPSTLRIQPSRLHFGKLTLNFAGKKYQQWFADIPAGTNIETTMKPDYWAHYTQQLRELDIVEMFCEDGSWEALCRVMFVGSVEVKLSLVSSAKHSAAASKADEGDYEVKWISPSVRFGVVRKDNGDVIKDHIQTKTEAQAFLQNHQSKLKA